MDRIHVLSYCSQRISSRATKREKRPKLIWPTMLSIIAILLPTVVAFFRSPMVAYAAIPAGYSEYYIPGSEQQLWDIFNNLDSDPALGNSMHSVIAVTATLDGTTIYYDHWEDGYDFDPNNPATADETHMVDAGDVAEFESSNIPVNPRGTGIYYDGQDRIYVAGGPVTVTRASWPESIGTVFALAWEVYPTKPFLNSYVVPVGEDLAGAPTNYDDFDRVYVLVQSTSDGNAVQIDDPTIGGIEVSTTLNQGEVTQLYNVNAGTTVSSSAPVQVQFIVGQAQGGQFSEARGFSTVPTNLWDNEYFNPVSGFGSGNTDLFVYNPHTSTLTINFEDSAGTGSFTIPANSTLSYSDGAGRLVPQNSGVHLYADDIFWAIGAADTESANYDWGFSLVPAYVLTEEYFVGWAPGSSNTVPNENGSPMYITPVNDDTTVYVDYSPTNGVADATYTLDKLNVQKVFDPDFENTGMHIWATGPIAVAWGQDPDTASVGNPYLDMGYTTLPLPVAWMDLVLSIDKSADVTALPASAGQTATFTLAVPAYTLSVDDVSVVDTLPTGWSYVPDSTTITYPDTTTVNGAAANPAISGQTLTWALAHDMAPNDILTIVFQAQTTATAAAGYNENEATASGTRLSGTQTFSATDSTFVYLADLTVDKDTTTSAVAAGGVATYTIVANNSGTDPLTNVTITDSLPTDFTFASATISENNATRITISNPSVGDNALSWGTWTINGGGAVTITFAVNIAPSVAPGTYDNTATVTSSETGPVDDAGSTAQDSGTPSGQDPEDDEDVSIAASISGEVREDSDGDGDLGDPDSGISGVTVVLWSDPNGDGDPSDGTPVLTTTTSITGSYIFSTVLPGDYVVVETDPSGFDSTADTDAPNDHSISVSVSSGDNSTGNNFLDTDPANISGQVREDTDGDGDFGDPDSGISGVTIVLWSDPNSDSDPSDGTPILTTTTTATGNYTFTNVTPGDYVVVETDPSGFNSTADTDAPNDNNIGVTLTSGTDSTGNDFLDTDPADIFGQVREDADNDGDLGDPDSGISGVTVVLWSDPNGDGDPSDGSPVLTTATTASGNYTFTNVTPGDYVVVETDPSGYASTADTDAPNDNNIGVTLTSGTDSTGNDFLDTDPANISGQVREDTDGDGDLGDPDSGINGVTVVLWSDPNGDGDPSDGSPVLTTTTTASGNYTFTNVTPGDYVVVETDPSGFNSTADTNAPNDNNIGVALVSGTDNPGNDFLDTDPADISGQVRNDTDGDGNLADPDSGINGVTVVLWSDPNDDGDPSDGTPVFTTTTTASGDYTFTNVTPGDYVVVESDPSGYASTADTDAPNDNNIGVTLVSGTDNIGNDFLDTNPADISGQVRNDTDGDGNLADPDSGINGVTIVLWSDPNGDGDPSDGTPILTTTTTATGDYTFTNVTPGDYVVVETDPGGYASTADTDAPNDNNIGVTLTSGSDSTDNDFLDTPASGQIGEFIWEDLDFDGVQDPGENGLSGVTIVLYDATNTPILTTTTNASGVYSFTNLVPGDYVVAVSPPVGYTISPQDAGTPNDDTADSDIDPATGRTVTTTLTAGEIDLTWDGGLFPIDPQLEIDKTVSVARIAPNQVPVVTYTLTVTNTGNIPMATVNVTDTMDIGVTYVPSSATPAPTSVSGQTLVWNDLTSGVPLQPGQSTQIVFEATVTTTIGSYNNTGIAQGDYNSGINYPGGTTTPDTDAVPVVVEDPAVALDKQITPPGLVDNLITFTIQITNTGPSILDVLPLFDTFSGPIDYVGGTPAANTVDNVNQIISWSDLTGHFGNISPGQMITIQTVFQLNASATEEITIANTAQISGGLDTANNGTNSPQDTVNLVNIPTAVQLISFEASQQGNQVDLTWETAIEYNNFGFRLLRSESGDLADATEIAFIDGKGAGTYGGASYHHQDQTVAPNQNYSYWLVDVDLNGTETHHGPITLTPIAVDHLDHTLFLPIVVH